jgi:hypothetical protein
MSRNGNRTVIPIYVSPTLTIEALFGEQIGEPFGRLHVSRLESGAVPLLVEVESAVVAVFEASVVAVVPAAVDLVETLVEESVGTDTWIVVALPLIVVSIRPAVAAVDVEVVAEPTSRVKSCL